MRIRARVRVGVGVSVRVRVRVRVRVGVRVGVGVRVRPQCGERLHSSGAAIAGGIPSPAAGDAGDGRDFGDEIAYVGERDDLGNQVFEDDGERGWRWHGRRRPRRRWRWRGWRWRR